MKFLVRNNVRTTVSRAISDSDTEIYINKATPPFRDPPQPDPDHILRLTIVYAGDSNPTIELVDVVSMESESGTELKLTVERSKEDPLENSFEFPIGSVIYLANTAEAIRGKANTDETVLIKKVRVDSTGVENPNGEYERLVSTDTMGREIILFTYEIL